MRQQLAGAFRGCARRNGLTHRVVLRERHLVVVAVDRRGGAVDECVDVQLLRYLQHGLRAADVGLLVRHRRLDRGPNAGPSSQVHNGIHISGVQGLQDSVCITDVRLDEREHLGGKVLDALLFDRPGIEGVKVVDCRDATAV